jgi:type II secretory pathway predicted ATPase ExeA
MKSEIKGDLIAALQTVQSDRHKLIILLGKFGSGKTAILKQAADELGGNILTSIWNYLKNCWASQPASS